MHSISKVLPFILTIALLSCGRSNSGDSAQSVDQKRPAIQIEHNNLPINYLDVGEGENTLLFVHGWCIDQSYWSNQVKEFSKDYRVVTIDLPGFGSSKAKPEDCSIEMYGTAVSEVINQLQLNNVILIGHSMGGDVILETALKNEAVKALVGIDNFKDVGQEMTDELLAEIEGFMTMLKENFSTIAPVYAQAALFHPSTDSVIVRQVMQDFAESDSLSAVSSLASLFDYTEQESLQLSKLKQKLYLINSDMTPTNVEALHATGVDFEVIDINGTGHYPMIEKPEQMNLLFRGILSKIG